MSASQVARFLIAGRPNSGKSSLFNRLVGARQKVGNYAGCTVEKKVAHVNWGGQELSFVDLPGTYSLKANSLDEEIALKEIEEADGHILMVLDGNNIRQELSLPLMLKEKGFSVIIAINMMDEVKANKKILDLAGMTNLSGIPFFPISAKNGSGIDALKQYLQKLEPLSSNIGNSGNRNIRELSIKELEESCHAATSISHSIADSASVSDGDFTIEKRNDLLDKFLIHPILGPIIFLSTMFVLFQVVFAWASPFSNAIDGFFSSVSGSMHSLIPVAWLASLLGDGLIAGIGSVLVFIPQIALLFFLIAFLELSGYLPRAAYMVDRLLRPYGLDGKVFIPLLSSMACAVPGIMAARTVENPRSRFIAIMIAPLMTCSARLPVYTLLIAAFVPASTVFALDLRGLVMAAMYVLGIVMALFVAFFLKKKSKAYRANTVDFMHLPNYRLPELRNIFFYVWARVSVFIKKAGTIIATMTVLMWFFLSFPQDHAFNEKMLQEKNFIAQSTSLSATQKQEKIQLLENQVASHGVSHSFAGRIGKFIEPIFIPLGYDWKLSIGLLASLSAREVFVSTIAVVFALGEGAAEEGDSLLKKLQGAKKADGSLAYSLATCLSLLMFFAFSLQCVSTIGIVRKETDGWRTPVIMFAYMFGIAYAASFVAYQFTSYLI